MSLFILISMVFCASVCVLLPSDVELYHTYLWPYQHHKKLETLRHSLQHRELISSSVYTNMTPILTDYTNVKEFDLLNVSLTVFEQNGTSCDAP